MRPENEASRFNPEAYNQEAQANPYSQIPDLVRKSILAKPKEARRSQSQLIGVIHSEDFGLTLFSVAEIQEFLSSTDPKQINKSANLLREVIHHGLGGDSPKEELTFPVNNQANDILNTIHRNHAILLKKRFLEQKLPGNYRWLIGLLPSMIDSFQHAQTSGLKRLNIDLIKPPVEGSTFEQAQQNLKRHNEWGIAADKLLHEENPEVSDILIDLLKTEPEYGQEKLWSQKYSKISLEDIEHMKYPLSDEQFVQISNFFTEAITDNTLPDVKKMMLYRLLLGQTFFVNLSGPIQHHNPNILANINYWQELLTYNLVFNENKERDTQLKNILQYIPQGLFYNIVFHASVEPIIMDPDGGKNFLESKDRHPILDKAFEDFISNYQGSGYVQLYDRELLSKYFISTVLPLLEDRLKELGMHDKFQEDIALLKKSFEENAYEKHHLKTIKELFEMNAGEEFLDRLTMHSEDIQEVTKRVWQDTLVRAHFLPMQQGINTIEFTESSIPSLLGIQEINLTRVGSEDDWAISIIFKMQNSPFTLASVFNKEGKLEFKAPLEQEIPGLYTMLNHIAVLVFHDLVVQERKEREGGVRPQVDKQRQEGEPSKSERDNIDTNGKDTQPRKSIPRSLPRVQSDKSLIKDVYKATNRTPRRVELHKRYLRGLKEYEIAVDLYNKALENQASEDIILWARDEVEAARENVFRVSQKKLQNLPAGFQLPQIEDPITGEVKYLKTWVIEHSNPKPTDEELKSPVKLYLRYYRGSSALASMDQMKPWFVGE